jgi:intein-encoded DNA endonuclease-like protein
LGFPLVPKKYLSDFVRGYFDGDGNVYIYRYQRKDRQSKVSISLSAGFTSGSVLFLEELQNKLKQYALLEGGSLHYRSRAYRLYYSTSDSKRLYEFMYGMSKIYLARKKNIFEKYSDMVE